MIEAIFGWLGFLGGLLTAAGDLLLDLKGRNNKKLGKYGFMESAWDTMAAWRFKASILLAGVGVPLYFLGLTSLAMQMTNTAFALAFWIVALAGAVGGFFIHAMICVFPLIYKKMRESFPFEAAEDVLILDITLLKYHSLYSFRYSFSAVPYCMPLRLSMAICPCRFGR